MATHKRSPDAEQGAYRQHIAKQEQSQLVLESGSEWHHQAASGQADLRRLQVVRSALEARDDLEQGCWVKADRFVQGLRREYDSRHRHSRQAPRQDASHAGSTLTSPDHDWHSSSSDNVPPVQHHISGHAQMLQHSQEGSRRASEEAIRHSSPARRYQRFLEEELGQLFNSQLSKGQSDRQLSGQASLPDRQLQSLDRQSQTISGQAAHPHRGPQHGHAQQSTAAFRQQANQAFVISQSNPMQPPRSLQHTAADSVTSNIDSRSQAASHSAYLAKLGNRYAGTQLTHSKPQMYDAQHRRQSKSAEPSSQPRARLQPQSGEKSVQRSASVHQESSQDPKISAAGQTAVIPTQPCHQQPEGDPEPVAHHAKGTTADVDRLKGNTKGQVAAVDRRRAGGTRLDEDFLQLKRVFGSSRGSSPQRRHLLLHNRLALFDSDSSSSEDEEPFTLVQRLLEHPMVTLSEQKVHLGGEASKPAAPRMSHASDQSQAAGGDQSILAIGQSPGSHLQQQAILAAAKAASDGQLVELQLRVSMLESEKAELSTQLSAAQRCMQTTEPAERDKVDIATSNQALDQVAEMHERLAAYDDKSKQLQRQLSELQSSARHKHEQLLASTDKAQQLQEQLTAADDNAKQLLEQLGLAQARADAAQLSCSALASDLGSAHTAVALKLERLVQAQSQIAQLQQQLQAVQDSAQQSKFSLKSELDSTQIQCAATKDELAFVQQQLQAAQHQAQTHLQTDSDLKKSLRAANCSAADKECKLVQCDTKIAALASQLQEVLRETSQARENAHQCESALQAELVSVHAQLANHQDRAESLQNQTQNSDRRAEQAEVQVAVQSQAIAELQKQLLTAQDAQQQAEDVRQEVVQAQAELVTKQASLVKAEAAAEALQQSLQDAQQAAAQTRDSAQQSESVLRAELQAAHAQQAAAQVGIMQAREQITVLQERLGNTSQKLTMQLVNNRETESALQAEVASLQCQFGSSQGSLERAQQETSSLQQRLHVSEQKVTEAKIQTAAASQALIMAQKQIQEVQQGAVQAQAELAAKQDSLVRAEAAVAAAEQTAAQAHDSAEQRQAALTAAHAQQAAALVRTMQARGQVTVLQERLDDTNQKLSKQLVTSQQAESALRAEATAAQQQLAALHEQQSELQEQVQVARQDLSKQEQAAHQAESRLKLELEAAQQAESDLAARLQASQQQQVVASAEVVALQPQLQTAHGDLTEQTTRAQQAEADLQRELSASKQTQMHLSSELLSAQQSESHLQAELDTVQQHQAAPQEQVSTLQQQLDSLQESLFSQQSLAQQSAADLNAQQLAAQQNESQLRAELTASQDKQADMKACITQLQQQLQSTKEGLVTQQKLARQSQSDLGVELLVAQQSKSQLRSELTSAQQQQTQVEKQLTALQQQLQSAQEEMSQQQKFTQEAETVSQAASRQAKAELQQSAESLKRRKVQVDQLQQQLHHAVDSSQHLEQHGMQLQQQLHVARADAAELQQHDQVHQAQLYTSSSSIAQLQATVTDTQAQLAAADARTDELQTQLAVTQLRCSELQSQLADAAEQAATSGETHAQLVAEAAQSNQQLTEISAQLAALRLRCSELESGVSLQQPAAVGSSVEPARPLGSHHISRRNSSSTDQQAGEQEEEEEGAVGAIVDKLWKDLQIERAARQLAEERLQAVEAEAISYQESMSSVHESHHSDSALLHQESDQFKSVTQLRHNLSGEAPAIELSQSLAEFKLEPNATEGSSPAQKPAEVMPQGTTLQCINPLFSQQEGSGSEASNQMPVAVHESEDADMAHQVVPAKAVKPSQSAASEATDEGSDPRAADSAQTSDPSAAELADPPQNSASSAYTEQQQQQEQVEALHSQLRAKASELQTAEAATEYVQRLLNAVSAENHDLRKQLDQKRILKQSVSELQRSSSSLASAKAQDLLAEHVIKGAALGLQPGTSQISALWASSPNVRRSLLPEYGSSEPYMRPDQTLEGAESLMGPPGLDSTLTEPHSDSMSGLSRPQQSDDGHIESLSQIALRRMSQQGAESSSPFVSGIKQNHTPASRGRTLKTALMRIGSMDPGSGPFGAALAAAERASITPNHKISRSLSQEEGSGWSGVSPSKASWTTLLKWGSRQLPFGKRQPDPEMQPDQSEQITELLRIIEHQSNHLEQYRAVLDTQRESNINLNADCERIQARLDLMGRRSRRTTSSDG